MRDCSTCSVKKRECAFGNDWELCLTCVESGEQCGNALDLSQIVQTNMHLRRIEKEAKTLLERIKQDSQLLTTLVADFRTSESNISALELSGAEDLELKRLQSERQQLALTGKQVSERHKADRSAYEGLYQCITDLRDHEETLFDELLCQAQRRTVNDCDECQNAGNVCVFSDDSEQCTVCQQSPRHKCQGSVDDEDTDRVRAALEHVERRIDNVLSNDLPDSSIYRSMKARLEQEGNAVSTNSGRQYSTAQERADYEQHVSRVNKTRKELEDFNKQSLVDDAAYQELQVRKRLLDEWHSKLLQRGVFYFDEMEELAGYPERRGHKRAEDMDHNEFREAVQWAADHPGQWSGTPLLAGTEPDRHAGEESASDSGIEI